MIFQRGINFPHLFREIPLSVTSKRKFTLCVVLTFLFNICRSYFQLIFTWGNQRPIVLSCSKLISLRSVTWQWIICSLVLRYKVISKWSLQKVLKTRTVRTLAHCIGGNRRSHLGTSRRRPWGRGWRSLQRFKDLLTGNVSLNQVYF